LKTYTAIIIDDEVNIRDALGLLLERYCPEILVRGFAASAEEGRQLLKSENINIIFLDISMPKEDGFAFLRSIQKERYGIIFVTAHEEYALRALKANAIDYLLKPVNPLELKEAVEKATEFFDLRTRKADYQALYAESLNNLSEQFLGENQLINKITVPEQFGFRIIRVPDLMYLQADSNYTILHLSSLEKIIATRSLIDFENILDNPLFFRIHKSTIINMSYLQGYSSFQGNFAILTDGTRLSISRRKILEFRELVASLTKSPSVNLSNHTE
jgi:two-component system, LytTR family, response regulator